MLNNLNIFNSFNPFELDFVNKLVLTTQQDLNLLHEEILKMYDYIYRFHELFPHEFNFKNELVLKDEFIINNFQKIYNQINLINENELKENSIVKIHYYLYDEYSFQYWEDKNIDIGELDENNILNTGTHLIFKSFKINWKDFIMAYEGYLN